MARKEPVDPRLLLTAILVFFCHLYFSSSGHASFLAAAKLKSIDLLYSWRAALSVKPSPQNVVVVGVDDESYRRLNRAWPWSRDVFAYFHKQLEALEPSVVGYDFMFAGQDTSAEADQALSGAFSTRRDVILATYFGQDGYLIQPVRSVMDAARGIGFVDRPLDADRVNRRTRVGIPLSAPYGKIYSFSAEIAFASEGLNAADQIRLSDGAVEFSADLTGRTVRQIPTDGKQRIWLSYRYRPADFSYIPFWKIVAGQTPASDVQGKIVLVGAISPALHDIHTTPLGAMGGVYIHANDVMAILSKDFIMEAYPANHWAIWLLLTFLTVLAGLLFYRLEFSGSLAFLIFVQALVWGTATLLFFTRGILAEVFTLSFLPSLAFFTVLVYKSSVAILDNIRLQHLVVTDALTGLYVQRYLTLRLCSEFNRLRQSNGELSLAMIDVDFFKNINDRFGHEQGNRVLTDIATILKNSVRGSDVVARYGGEEFCVLFLHSGAQATLQSVEQMRSQIEKYVFPGAPDQMRVTISGGICSSRNPEVRVPEDLIHLADAALYEAKNAGRNQVRVYRPKKGYNTPS